MQSNVPVTVYLEVLLSSPGTSPPSSKANVRTPYLQSLKISVVLPVIPSRYAQARFNHQLAPELLFVTFKEGCNLLSRPVSVVHFDVGTRWLAAFDYEH